MNNKTLCKWFGHKLPLGFGGGRPYLRILTTIIDGIGRKHAFLYGECPRCREEWNVANIHLPMVKKNYQISTSKYKVIASKVLT